jgi:hypothetical protein
MEAKMAHHATASARVVLGIPEVDAYSSDLLASCVVKPGGHVVSGEPNAARFYSVTTIARNTSYGGTRTVALCHTFLRAKEIVEANEGDIWEHSYMLVVIEEVLADMLYGGDHRNAYWYRWSLDNDCYEAIETPEPYADVVGFSIG